MLDKEEYYTDNLPREERRALIGLKKRINDGEIRISTSDKGGEFIVINQSFDKQITCLHLNNINTYHKCNKFDFQNCVKVVKNQWECVCRQCTISNLLKKKIDNNCPICPVTYELIKTHKIASCDLQNMDATKISCRPIISSCDGPADRVNWLPTFILTPL